MSEKNNEAAVVVAAPKQVLENGAQQQSQPAIPNSFDELMMLREQLHDADAGVTETMARMHFATTLRSMQETISTGVQSTLVILKEVDNMGSGGARSAPALAIYQTMAENAAIMRDLVADSSNRMLLDSATTPPPSTQPNWNNRRRSQ